MKITGWSCHLAAIVLFNPNMYVILGRMILLCRKWNCTQTIMLIKYLLQMALNGYGNGSMILILRPSKYWIIIMQLKSFVPLHNINTRRKVSGTNGLAHKKTNFG